MNARNEARAPLRLTTISHDGGETWEMVAPEPRLPDPICMGSVLRLSFQPDLILFSNAANTERRENGMLRVSPDGGLTWPASVVIEPGSFAYSCLCPLSASSVGILYETVEPGVGKGTGYRIKFQAVDVAKVVKSTS